MKSYNCKYTVNNLHGARSIIFDSEESVWLNKTPVASSNSMPISSGGSTYSGKLFSSEEIFIDMLLGLGPW
jgi:hypothetical protein